jgi:tripartite-type tricarboxylate transporter receptor subunit TctC
MVQRGSTKREEKIMNCLLRSGLGLAFGLAVTGVAAAQSINLVVPYPPGGSTDQVARILQDDLSKALGRSVIIDNRGGSSGNIGTAYVAKAAPDGSTILLATNAAMTINPFIFKSIPFDPVKDFTPITTATQGVIGIAVNSDIPVKSIKDLIAYAKDHPVNFGTAGAGSPHHIVGELLNRLGGVSMTHVPYRGGGPMMTDLLGGHINVGIIALSAILPQLPTGKIRLIAIAEKTRFSGTPDTPTVAETYPDFEVSAWFGFFGPAGMPADLVQRYNSAIAGVLHAPEVKKKLDDQALPSVGDSSQELAALVKRDLDRWGKLVPTMNIPVE